MPTITKNKIIYDEKDWLAGLHPQKSSTVTQKFGNFATFQSSFNPYRNLGYAGQGYLNTDYTNASACKSVILNVVPDGQNAYGIDAKDLLHKFNYSTKILTNSGGVFPHTITPHGGHTSIAGSDIVSYYHNVSSSRVKSIFYSWNDNTDGDVGRYDLSSTLDDDYMSTIPASGAVLTKGVSHPMIVGYDDILYIGNGRHLNAYDGSIGADGTYFQNVLSLPEDYEMIAMAKLPPRSLVIFAHKSGASSSSNRKNECKAFFWDYLDSDPYKIENLYDNYIWDAFEYKGTVGCFTGGRNKDGNYLKIFDGSEFKNMCNYSDGGPCHGGCDVDGDQIYWNANGKVYTYGNNYNVKSVLNITETISSDTGYYPGFLKILLPSAISASNGKTDGNGAVIQYLDTTKYSYSGYFYSDLTDIGDERIQITGITIYFADEFTGGRGLTFALRDRVGYYYISGIVDLLTVGYTNRIYRAKPINYTGGTPIPPLDGVGISIGWVQGSGSSVSPIINKIVLDYTPVTIN